MKRPSKLRVLLAVNWWRIRHKRTPILYLPRATGYESLAATCPLKYALSVDSVGVTAGPRVSRDLYEWTAVANVGERKYHLSHTLSAFVNAFDLDDDAYPELRPS